MLSKKLSGVRVREMQVLHSTSSDSRMKRANIPELVKDWVEAWNSRDVERILSHYSDDVVFEAQTVVNRWGKPNGRLQGKEELRQHFTKGLELASNLHFTLEDLFLAPSGYAVVYKRENGNRVIDAVELNDAGLAIKVIAYYREQQR